MDRSNKVKKVLIFLRLGDLREPISQQRAIIGDTDKEGMTLLIDDSRRDNQEGLSKLVVEEGPSELWIYDLASLDFYLESLHEFVTFLSILENSKIKLMIATDQAFELTSPTKILKAFHLAKKQLHKEHIKQSFKKRQESGLNIGRPSSIESMDIKELRERGLTYREIAQSLNISIGSVQRGLA